MNVSDLREKLGLEILTSKDYEDSEIKGCYIGDLLSWVMGRAQQDDVWITIMSNINIAAVASLADVACVILAEGVRPDEGVAEKADKQGIIIFSSDKTSYELACDISKALS